MSLYKEFDTGKLGVLVAEYQDHWGTIELAVHNPSGDSAYVELDPAQALDLASILLQFATQQSIREATA